MLNKVVREQMLNRRCKPKTRGMRMLQNYRNMMLKTYTKYLGAESHQTIANTNLVIVTCVEVRQPVYIYWESSRRGPGPRLSCLRALLQLLQGVPSQMNCTLLRKINWRSCCWFFRWVRSNWSPCFTSASKTVRVGQARRSAWDKLPDPEKISNATGSCLCSGMRCQLLKSCPSTFLPPEPRFFDFRQGHWRLGWCDRRLNNDGRTLQSTNDPVSGPWSRFGDGSTHRLTPTRVSVGKYSRAREALRQTSGELLRTTWCPPPSERWKGVFLLTALA